MTKKTILISLAVFVAIIIVLFQVAKRTSKTVVVNRKLNASVARVWQKWNDAESIKKWWGPKDYTAPVVKNDLKLNGTFLLSMKAPDGKISWNTGKYTEIIPYKKIVSNMAFADENGKAVSADHYGIPGVWPDEITVIIEFNEIDGKTTEVTIQEEGIPMIMFVFAKLGWQQQLDKFEALLK